MTVQGPVKKQRPDGMSHGGGGGGLRCLGAGAPANGGWKKGCKYEKVVPETKSWPLMVFAVKSWTCAPDIDGMRPCPDPALRIHGEPVRGQPERANRPKCFCGGPTSTEE